MTSALSRRRQWRRLSPIRPLPELRWSTRGCEQEPCRLRFINASRSKSWDDGEIERRITEWEKRGNVYESGSHRLIDSTAGIDGNTGAWVVVLDIPYQFHQHPHGARYHGSSRASDAWCGGRLHARDAMARRGKHGVCRDFAG